MNTMQHTLRAEETIVGECINIFGHHIFFPSDPGNFYYDCFEKLVSDLDTYHDGDGSEYSRALTPIALEKFSRKEIFEKILGSFEGERDEMLEIMYEYSASWLVKDLIIRTIDYFGEDYVYNYLDKVIANSTQESGKFLRKIQSEIEEINNDVKTNPTQVKLIYLLRDYEQVFNSFPDTSTVFRGVELGKWFEKEITKLNKNSKMYKDMIKDSSSQFRDKLGKYIYTHNKK